jgi:hypothetical protein
VGYCSIGIGYNTKNTRRMTDDELIRMHYLSERGLIVYDPRYYFTTPPPIDDCEEIEI